MRTIQDLNYLERENLKQVMLIELMEAEDDSPSWGQLTNADEIISDNQLDEYYQGVIFSDDDFLSACIRLHSDESDPEFMCQDAECMPDGVTLPEDFSRKDFDDVITVYREEEKSLHPEETEEETAGTARFRIVDYSEKALAVYGDTKQIKEQLKQLGGRFNSRLRDGAGWIFSKQKAKRLQTLLSDVPMESERNHASASRKADAPDEYLENLKEWIRLFHQDDEAYYLKNYYGAAKWMYQEKEYYYLVEKKKIDTSFPFSDEGPGYEHYLKATSSEEAKKRYFIFDNMRCYKNERNVIHTSFGYNEKSRKAYMNGGFFVQQNESIEDVKNHLMELDKTLAACGRIHEKRLYAYLNRWGVSKLRFYTYWADR